MRTLLLATLLLLAGTGCALFGLAPCEEHSNCPDGQFCNVDGVCEDGKPPTDAGEAADAASSDSSSGGDAGVENDAASVADAAVDTDATADASAPDSAVETDASTADAATSDAGSIAVSCANPPCGYMPDSITDVCRLGATDAGPCPAPGEDYAGQDSTYHILVPIYSEPATGVVLDEITGLQWEQVASFADRSWAAAQTYCDELNLASHDDWRMPSFRELVTLLDYGRAYPIAAMDPTYFPAPTRDWFWSSSAGGGLGYYWVVDFWGFLHPQIQLNTVSVGTQGAVRCVRGSPLVEGELVFGSGTWTDQRSGLAWQAASLVDVTWDEALAQCEALELAGRDDWRLPNIKELETLVDRNTNAEVYTFEDLRTETGGNTYWSSTPYLIDYGIWAIMFNNGQYVNRYPSSDYRARCVRGPGA